MPTYKFHGYTFDSTTGEVTKPDGRVSRLEPLAAKVLTELIVHRGELVTHESLQGEFETDDAGFKTAVVKTRKALDDEAGKPKFVQTLPKRGYRFIADFESDEPPGESAPPEVSSQASALPAGAPDVEHHAGSKPDQADSHGHEADTTDGVPESSEHSRSEPGSASERAKGRVYRPPWALPTVLVTAAAVLILVFVWGIGDAPTPTAECIPPSCFMAYSPLDESTRERIRTSVDERLGIELRWGNRADIGSVDMIKAIDDQAVSETVRGVVFGGTCATYRKLEAKGLLERVPEEVTASLRKIAVDEVKPFWVPWYRGVYGVAVTEPLLQELGPATTSVSWTEILDAVDRLHAQAGDGSKPGGIIRDPSAGTGPRLLGFTILENDGAFSGEESLTRLYQSALAYSSSPRADVRMMMNHPYILLFASNWAHDLQRAIEKEDADDVLTLLRLEDAPWEQGGAGVLRGTHRRAFDVVSFLLDEEVQRLNAKNGFRHPSRKGMSLRDFGLAPFEEYDVFPMGCEDLHRAENMVPLMKSAFGRMGPENTPQDAIN